MQYINITWRVCYLFVSCHPSFPLERFVFLLIIIFFFFHLFFFVLLVFLSFSSYHLNNSSTFTDFFSEREVLVKQVFPKLRVWCAERRLFLIEVDLRWGVPRESSSGAFEK